MSRINTQFEEDGFVVIDEVFNDYDVAELIKSCELDVCVNVGTRDLLCLQWVKDLARNIASRSNVARLLPMGATAVQCNYFSKDVANNWFVGLHRDLSIPVKSRIDSDQWRGWSVKEGILFAQPPISVLKELVVVRLHLDDNTSDNGALELVVGSHKDLDKKGPRHLCVVKQGGVLLMRPLSLHSSAKLISGKRRVLHFVFSAQVLPDGAQWANSV